MIVEITSWVPTAAFSQPAIAAQAPPITAASTIEMMMWSTGFMLVNEVATHTAMTAPTVYWPWAPMLKRPTLNANATESPVRISGAVATSVSCRFWAASIRAGPVTHGNSQLRPVPSKIAP